MPLPERNYRGARASVTMMELRKLPGEVLDRVARGMTVDVTKNGKRIATMVPADAESDETVILSDGTILGATPLTFRWYAGYVGY